VSIPPARLRVRSTDATTTKNRNWSKLAGGRAPVGRRAEVVEKDYGHMIDRGVDRADLPLTPLQAKLAAVLTAEPLRPGQLAERSGLTARQVDSAVRYLAGKGLAARSGRGWMATPRT
jgi:predicted Rossmann fold nucleotide-binding protein DprA/Smf involved in DNA uptake